MQAVKQLTTLILVLLSFNLNGQYSETFTSVNKGILEGPCGATSATCANFDFDGVDWFVNGNLDGIDSGDFVSSDGNDLSFEDVDEEVCLETPVLDISGVAGNFSFTVDLVWTGFDSDDYIDVEYQIDGGAWLQIPNAIGGGDNTIEYAPPAANIDGSTNIGETGLSGTSTLSIRVCTDFNLFGTFENVSMDNIIVPEAGAVVLPVKWADFKVRSQRDGNQLDWATYTEFNNERFDIEKSVDGMNNFRKIGSIDGVGNSTKISRYEFMDREISYGTYYYRIKQVDFDEKFEYSEIVLVKIDMETEISIYPNPADDYIIVNSGSGLDNAQQFQIYDAMGRLISLETSKENDYAVRLNTSSLEAGIYFIKLSSGNMRKVIKL
tara:strand:- start:1890 stop:3029 length:1140 start_codon:yes stop_codon:yes gene_type:complete